MSSCSRIWLETPPRAWGRLLLQVLVAKILRNTPTGVGKTQPVLINANDSGKHPHGRGEDSDMGTISTPTPETPPRAWGRRTENSKEEKMEGNTPTGVGKTHVSHRTGPASEKHPHGRGEDCLHQLGRRFGDRNTPTGVGKTRLTQSKKRRHEKHPHGRGEDDLRRTSFDASEETPPRAWGRR